jgi:hypothetical protein
MRPREAQLTRDPGALAVKKLLQRRITIEAPVVVGVKVVEINFPLLEQ